MNPKTCFGKSAALGQPVERPIKNVEKPIENYVGKPTQVVDVGMQKLKHWHVPFKENLTCIRMHDGFWIVLMAENSKTNNM